MKNDSQFRAIPKKKNNKIPFSLDEHALLDWLNSLSNQSGEKACLSILRAVQALNEVDIISVKRIDFLNTITNYLQQYITYLAGGGWDAGFPLSVNEKIYAEAVTWNYLVLAEGYFIAAEDTGNKNERVHAMYLSMLAIGQAQLHIAAIYSEPNEGFWKMVYRNYTWAENKKILDIAVKDFKNNTVNQLFKKILTFEACDTNQFRPRDMLTIFNFLDRVCADLPIYKNPDEKHGLFVFDLKTDNPPYNLLKSKNTLTTNSSIRYFSPVVIAHNIYRVLENGGIWNGALKSINEALFKRVIKTLGLAQKRRFTRLNEGNNVTGIIGFAQIIALLRLNITEASTTSADPDSSSLQKDEKLKITEKELQLVDDKKMGVISGEFEEINYAIAADNSIWGSSHKNLISPENIILADIKIFDSSAKGYSVYWSNSDIKAKIGDIFGIVSEDEQRLEIAIIRRIMMNSENDFRFGSEVIGFESEAVYMSYPDNREEGDWGIFIPGIKALKQADTLIYSMGKFKSGESVVINRRHTKVIALLVRELNSTSGVSHVELAYPPSK